MQMLAETPAEIFARARTLRAAGDLDEAAELCLRLLTISQGNPSARFLLGQVYLARGRYEEGWPLYEARNELLAAQGQSPGLPFPPWRGEDLAGRTILILDEQGFGDQIMFARFVPSLVAMGAKVTLTARSELARLFQGLGAKVVGPNDVPEPHDFWAFCGSLPALLGLTLAALPTLPYLPSAPPSVTTRHIGVVWQGRPTHANDANRSFAPTVYKPLLDLGVKPVPLAPAHSGARDFFDTARMIDQLDAVVTVDTSVAHLAGAMGRPVYIALPAVGSDWRWMQRRSDSPWYPSATLYRQSPDLNWTPVIEAIRDDLSKRFLGGT